MKTFTQRIGVIKVLFLSCSLCCIYNISLAQLPTCTGTSAGLIYDQSGTGIYNFDPTQAMSSTNPSLNTITGPSNMGGLAVSDNLNATSPSPTFYTIVNNFIYYYNGTTWVNTGNSAGNGSAVNLGAGGGYLYNLVGFTGQVYTYNGSGSATLLTTVTGFNGGGPYDISADCAGNFYILNTTPPQWLHEYDYNGNQIQSWTLTGAPNASAGGGMAIIGNNIYWDNSGGYVSGVISGTNVTCTVVAAGGLNPSPSDFASCPVGGVSLVGAVDTFFYCPGSTGITLNAAGQPPYSWSVISGPAVINGSGASVTVTTTANSRIAYTSTSGCGTNSDTIDIIVPTANISSGGDKTIYGCGTYLDSLKGFLYNTQSWLTYNIGWSPSGSILSGGNTLTPTINPSATTTYTLTVSTPASEGGCIWTDTARVTTVDASTHAHFTYDIHYGCTADTIDFTNTSLAALNYRWNFDDGSGADTLANPQHVYTTQGLYDVGLIVTNVRCIDSTKTTIDTRHPLKAQFTVDKDSICQGQSVTFTNTSVTTTQNGINPTYMWSFGDGSTSNQMNDIHQFSYMGNYNVQMIVTDFVPCSDTAYQTIVVDSQSTATIVTGNNVFCAGQQVSINGIFSTEGITQYYWDFGNGDVIFNTNPVAHAYDQAGTHQVTLITNYRLCASDTATTSYTIKDYPAINIGSDTTMCPNAGPIYITDTVNTGNPNAQWLWSTGDTTAHIMATQPGTYWATVTINGCSATDSITILKDCYLDVPNAFTPNNDGVNDYFFPRQMLSMGVVSFKMDVYDRWGEEIFATTSSNGRGWDGKFNGIDQPEGVYIYMIDVTYKDGRTEHYQGNITLLR